MATDPLLPSNIDFHSTQEASNMDCNERKEYHTTFNYRLEQQCFMRSDTQRAEQLGQRSFVWAQMHLRPTLSYRTPVPSTFWPAEPGGMHPFPKSSQSTESTAWPDRQHRYYSTSPWLDCP